MNAVLGANWHMRGETNAVFLPENRAEERSNAVLGAKMGGNSKNECSIVVQIFFFRSKACWIPKIIFGLNVVYLYNLLDFK